MRTILRVSAILAGAMLAGAAAAADPAPVYNWTGFYIGGHVGGAWGDFDYAVNSSPAWGPLNGAVIARDGSRVLDSSGMIGGAQFGYNWQIHKVVVGIESDWSALGTKEAFDTGALPGAGVGAFSQYRYDMQVDWLATLRARLGVAGGSTNGWLIYVTGGLALGNVESSFSHFRPTTGYLASGTEQAIKLGWTVGGGLEYALRGPWTIKAEYLYVDFGAVDYQTAWTVNPNFYETVSTDTHLHIARFGINYKFGGSAAAKD